MKCPYCKFIKKLFKNDEIKNNKEYAMRRMFVFLHEGKNCCDYGKLEKKLYRRLK